MKDEYAYLVAIIDWYSRYIISWDLSLTLNISQVMKAIKEGIFKYGKPSIINRGWNLTENICIERFFKRLKSEKLHSEDIKVFIEAKLVIVFFVMSLSIRWHLRDFEILLL